jgi:hypothetical protein
MTPHLHSLERAPSLAPAAGKPNKNADDDWFARAQQQREEDRLQKDESVQKFLEDVLGRERMRELDEDLDRELSTRPLLDARDRISPAARELEPVAPAPQSAGMRMR